MVAVTFSLCILFMVAGPGLPRLGRGVAIRRMMGTYGGAAPAAGGGTEGNLEIGEQRLREGAEQGKATEENGADPNRV